MIHKFYDEVEHSLMQVLNSFFCWYVSMSVVLRVIFLFIELNSVIQIKDINAAYYIVSTNPNCPAMNAPRRRKEFFLISQKYFITKMFSKMSSQIY